MLADHTALCVERYGKFHENICFRLNIIVWNAFLLQLQTKTLDPAQLTRFWSNARANTRVNRVHLCIASVLLLLLKPPHNRWLRKKSSHDSNNNNTLHAGGARKLCARATCQAPATRLTPRATDLGRRECMHKSDVRRYAFKCEPLLMTTTTRLYRGHTQLPEQTRELKKSHDLRGNSPKLCLMYCCSERACARPHAPQTEIRAAQIFAPS